MDSPIALLGGRVWQTVLPLFNILRSIVPQYIQFWFQQISCLLAVSTCTWITRFTPIGFPDSGNGLWYTSPGTSWAQELLPIGNGHLAGMIPFIVVTFYLKRLHPAAMIHGGTIQESIQLNIESLWSGGPFQDPVCHHRPIVITSSVFEELTGMVYRRTMAETTCARSEPNWQGQCREFVKVFLPVRLAPSIVSLHFFCSEYFRIQNALLSQRHCRDHVTCWRLWYVNANYLPNGSFSMLNSPCHLSKARMQEQVTFW